MDLILILLVVAERADARGVIASELAEPSARTPRDVRASLTRLESLGLVTHEVGGTRGPLGTYRWRATASGRAAAARPLSFIAKRGAL